MHIIHTIPQVLWAYSTTWQRPPVCLDDQERERTRERECVYPRRHVGLTSTVVSTGSRVDLECGSVQQQNSQSIQPRTQRNRGTSPLDPPTQPHKSRVKFNSQCRSLVEVCMQTSTTNYQKLLPFHTDCSFMLLQTSTGWVEVWSKLRPSRSKFGRNFDQTSTVLRVAEPKFP